MISMHIFAFDKVQLILIGLSSFEVLGVRESPVDISYFSKWQNSWSWDRPGMDPLSNIWQSPLIECSPHLRAAQNYQENFPMKGESLCSEMYRISLKTLTGSCIVLPEFSSNLRWPVCWPWNRCISAFQGDTGWSELTTFVDKTLISGQHARGQQTNNRFGCAVCDSTTE